MSDKTPKENDLEKLMNEQEVAELIGMSRQWLRQGRRDGFTHGPPFYKISSRVLYAPADVRAWLEENRHDPADD